MKMNVNNKYEDKDFEVKTLGQRNFLMWYYKNTDNHAYKWGVKGTYGNIQKDRKNVGMSWPRFEAFKEYYGLMTKKYAFTQKGILSYKRYFIDDEHRKKAFKACQEYDKKNNAHQLVDLQYERNAWIALGRELGLLVVDGGVRLDVLEGFERLTMSALVDKLRSWKGHCGLLQGVKKNDELRCLVEGSRYFDIVKCWPTAIMHGLKTVRLSGEHPRFKGSLNTFISFFKDVFIDNVTSHATDKIGIMRTLMKGASSLEKIVPYMKYFKTINGRTYKHKLVGWCMWWEDQVYRCMRSYLESRDYVEQDYRYDGGVFSGGDPSVTCEEINEHIFKTLGVRFTVKEKDPYSSIN